jgi:hypothetical protein
LRSPRSSRLALICLVCLSLTLPALAQDEARAEQAAASGGGGQDLFGYQGWGLRGGLNIDPDQLMVGAHLDLGQIVPQLRFMPNLEIGFGDNQTLVGLWAEVQWVFRNVQLNTPESAGIWRPYVGGGLGVIYRDHDVRGNDTDLGLSLIGGFDRQMQNGQHFLVELGFGLSDAPNFTLMAGYTF